MWALRAFLLGALAVDILAYAVSAALATQTATTFGVGLVLLALAGGLANLAAAHVIRRRSGHAGDRVD